MLRWDLRQELACGVHISTQNSGLVFYYCQRETVGVYVDILVDEIDFVMSRNVTKQIHRPGGR